MFTWLRKPHSQFIGSFCLLWYCSWRGWTARLEYISGAHLFELGIWCIILVVLLVFAWRKAKDCRELSHTQSMQESFWSLFGLSIDPYRTSVNLSALTQLQVVDVPISVTIKTYNANGFRHRQGENGWTAQINGTKAIIADFIDRKNGTYTCTFKVRIVGQYSFNVSFRGISMLPQPLLFSAIAGEAYAPNCIIKAMGINSFLVSPGRSCFVEIETVDRLGNFIIEGGNSKKFTLSKKNRLLPSKWEDLDIQVHDMDNGSYEIFYSMKTVGIFDLRFRYDGAIIHSNMCVSVLTTPDLKTIEKSIKRKRAKFKVTAEGNKTELVLIITQSRVSVCIYKYLLLKQKLCNMKMNKHIQLNFRENDPTIIELEDSCYMQQMSIRTDQRNLVFGTFCAFMNSRHSGGFDERRATFYNEIRRKHIVSSNTHIIQVDRKNLIKTAYKKLKTFNSKAWKTCWRVIFLGERAIDEGGVHREFLTLLVRELFNPDGEWNLFGTMCDESRALHPKPSRELSRFEFAGKVLAKCLYDTILYDPCLVNVHFTSSFYKKLLGFPIHFSDIEHDDPQCYLSKVKYILENDVDDCGLDLYFTAIEQSDAGILSREIELKPNGANIAVTEANKIEYLLLFAEYKLVHAVHKQIQAFVKGFCSIIPDSLLNIFDERELELLICGLPSLSVTEMKAHTQLDGYRATDKVVTWFWVAVENFTEEEKAKLIQFITGSSQVPLEGFAAFNPPITISRSYSPIGSLPCAHTCFNSIDLPEYNSYKDLAKKVLLAVTEGSEGFAFG